MYSLSWEAWRGLVVQLSDKTQTGHSLAPTRLRHKRASLARETKSLACAPAYAHYWLGPWAVARSYELKTQANKLPLQPQRWFGIATVLF